MIDRYLLYFATLQALDAHVPETLCAAARFAPTHWSPQDGGKARDFDPGDVSEVLSGGAQLELHRRKAPGYDAHLLAVPGGLSHLKLTLTDPADAATGEAVFALADTLAGLLVPEYGLVHCWQKGSPDQAYRLSGNMTFYDLQKTGPRPPSARTWIGRHIMGLDVAGFVEEEAGATRTPWDGRVITLADRPWQAEESALASRQQALVDALRPTGIWGNYGGVLPRPGPNWKPVGQDPL